MDRIDIEKERLADYCRRNGIEKLSFFGSVLRDDFNEESDVDVLVEFKPGTRVGFFTMARLEQELSEIIGRKVDLRTLAEISRYFRDEVLENSVIQYAEE